MERLILQKHKTLQRCVDYLMEQAWELVDEEAKNQRIKVGFAVTSDTVFSWGRDYYAQDDKEEMEKKEKEAEERFRAKITSADGKKKPAAKPRTSKRSKKAETDGKEKISGKSEKTEEKPEEVQISLFDVGMTA
uniref:Cas9 inhibitor AcrIIA9 family protein n=1 Tax=Enterocloster clostridioformis TaxID=1531 RepID=UPI002F3E47A5